MKYFLRITVLTLAIVGLTSCSEIVKKTLQDNPEIVFEAIKKDPAQFVKTAQEAFKMAEQGQRENDAKAEKDKREEQFKNPLQPVVAATRPIMGPKDAAVTIVEYSDLQCPACQYGARIVDQVMAQYEGKVKLILKHFPIESKHPNARRGSEFFEAIALQDNAKAFAFKKKVFERQKETYGPPEAAEKFYTEIAKSVGANVGQVASDLKSKKAEFTAKIQKDMEEAQKFQINGTPGYIINGVSLHGAYGVPVFKEIIDRHLKGS